MSLTSCRFINHTYATIDMTLTTLLLNIVLTSGFCIGLRIVSGTVNGDPMILCFLRWPYDWLQGELKHINGTRIKLTRHRCSEQKKWNKTLVNSLIYLLKPIIGCVICMSAVHTLTVWYLLHGTELFTLDNTGLIVINIFCTAALNTILYYIAEWLVVDVTQKKEGSKQIIVEDIRQPDAKIS